MELTDLWLVEPSKLPLKKIWLYLNLFFLSSPKKTKLFCANFVHACIIPLNLLDTPLSNLCNPPKTKNSETLLHTWKL